MADIIKITDFNARELDVYARLTEAQLLNKDKPEEGIFIAESPKVVMNPTNVGAIIRSAAALNMDAVLLTPGCSNPLYRRAIRVSMGTVFRVPWTFIDEEEAGEWQENGMEYLKSLRFRTASMALHDESVDIDDVRLRKEEKLAVILGTEGDGLSDATIADSDYTIKNSDGTRCRFSECGSRKRSRVLGAGKVQ